MEGLKKILIQPVKSNKNIHSEAHYWADTISSAFGERKKFGMYLGVIKRIGIAEAKRIFTEITDSRAQNPAKLFLWKTSQSNLKK